MISFRPNEWSVVNDTGPQPSILDTVMEGLQPSPIVPTGTPGSTSNMHSRPKRSDSNYWPDDDYIGSGDSGRQISGGGGNPSSPGSATDIGRSWDMMDPSISAQDNDGVSWAENKELKDHDIIGLPPIAYMEGEGGELDRMKKLIVASMPVVELQPCMGQFGESGEGLGMNLFHLDPDRGEDTYRKIIETAGFNIRDLQVPIKIAFLNEGQLGESWNSAYGDTTFESSINQAGSTMLGQLRQMTGATDLTDLFNRFSGRMGQHGDQAGGMLAMGMADLLGGAGIVTGAGFAALGSLVGADASQAAQKILAGSKVDFPHIWQGSTFEPMYTLTVRLYNPYPRDKEAYENFILVPMAKILGFCVPITDSRYVYDFPIMCKARCPGLFKLSAAVVNSVNVIKGGANSEITFQQHPSVVDMQITLQSLYSTMVASTDEESEEETDDERPTLKRYFDNLRDWYDYRNYLNSDSQQALIDTPLSIEDKVFPSDTDWTDQPLGATDMLTTRVPDGISGLSQTLGAITDPINMGVENITNVVGNGIGAVTGQIDNVFNAVENVTQPVFNVANNINGQINSITGSFNTLSNSMSGITGITNGLGTVTTQIEGISPLNFVGIDNVLNNVRDIDRNIVGVYSNVNTVTTTFETAKSNFDGLQNDLDNAIQVNVPDINFALMGGNPKGVYNAIDEETVTLKRLEDVIDKNGNPVIGPGSDPAVMGAEEFRDASFDILNAISPLVHDSDPSIESSLLAIRTQLVMDMIPEIDSQLNNRLKQIDFSTPVLEVRNARKHLESEIKVFRGMTDAQKDIKRPELIDLLNDFKMKVENLIIELESISSLLQLIIDETQVEIDALLNVTNINFENVDILNTDIINGVKNIDNMLNQIRSALEVYLKDSF